ncbi:DUF6417 family protein, partial [Streptomyces sp. NPDC001215]
MRRPYGAPSPPCAPTRPAETDSRPRPWRRTGAPRRVNGGRPRGCPGPRDQPRTGYVAQDMDDYDPLGLDDLESAPVERTMERLALMSREEADDLLRLLATVAEQGGPLPG